VRETVTRHMWGTRRTRHCLRHGEHLAAIAHALLKMASLLSLQPLAQLPIGQTSGARRGGQLREWSRLATLDERQEADEIRGGHIGI
jgi:hypothetical protein